MFGRKAQKSSNGNKSGEIERKIRKQSGKKEISCGEIEDYEIFGERV